MRPPAVFLFMAILASAASAGPCPYLGFLPPNGEVGGSIEETSCRLSSGVPYSQFQLHLPAPGKLSLQAQGEAAAFSFSIMVRDAADRRVTGDALERGVYTVVVTGEGGAVGKFTLKSSFQAEPGTLCRTMRALGLADEALGHLSVSSCRNPGDLPYDSFRVTVFGPGILTIALEGEAFPADVLLRSSDGKLLASGRPEIVSEISGTQVLTVVVIGDNAEASGKYKVKTSFIPREGDPCKNRAVLDSPRTVNDSISEGSCPLSGEAFAHTYTLRTSEPGTAELRLTGLRQAGVLLLLDRSGEVLAIDYDSGGLGRPFLRPYLPAGVYTLLILASRQGGEYALDYQFTPEPLQACPVLALSDGAATTGTLSGASCRGQDTLRDSYRFTLASPGTIDLVMASNEFSSLLTLRDAWDNVLSGSNGDPGVQASVVATLPAGDYTAVAASSFPGGYAIGYRLAAHELPACPAATVNVNVSFIALLGAGSCTGSDGQPADNYEFQVPSDGTVALTMTAQSIDSYLMLLDADGNPVRRDDNSYGGADALILQYLRAGTYRLVARSAAGGEIGRYRIEIFHAPGDRPIGCRPARSLAAGESLKGLLTLTSCQWSDDTFADVYRWETGAPGPVEVTLQSTQFDSYLELLDSKGNVVATDDDSAGSGNARIAADLQPGVYYVVAKSYAGNGYAPGEYTIALR